MWRTLIIAIIVLVVMACDQSAVAPSLGDVGIIGRVLDYSTRTALSNAVVTFTPQINPPEDVQSNTAADADGFYALMVPRRGLYGIAVNGRSVGSASVNGSLSFRGDLLIDRGTCIARYGTVIDRETLRPIRGATINYGSRPTTGPDGWYRLDLGCPAVLPLPGGTTFMTVSHPDYKASQVVLGRGVFGVSRLDIALTRQ